MFIPYFAKTYAEAANGTVERLVECEKCSTEFHYKLTRSAMGFALAHYWIGQKSAKARGGCGVEETDETPFA